MTIQSNLDEPMKSEAAREDDSSVIVSFESQKLFQLAIKMNTFTILSRSVSL
jgi:hypothetical protein